MVLVCLSRDVGLGRGEADDWQHGLEQQGERVRQSGNGCKGLHWCCFVVDSVWVCGLRGCEHVYVYVFGMKVGGAWLVARPPVSGAAGRGGGGALPECDSVG